LGLSFGVALPGKASPAVTTGRCGWDLDSGEPALGPLAGHHDPVRVVAVGVRQGRPVIVSGGADQTVRVWDLEAERHATLRIELGYEALSVASTPDRLVVATTAELLQVDLL
jgi:WD40 repeat protein